MELQILSCLLFCFCSTHVIEATQHTDDISCTFKDDFCHWRVNSSSGVGWTRYQYKSKLSLSGPQEGTSGGDNFYIYFDTSIINTTRGSETLLISPPFPNGPQGVCIRFYYHMYGDTMGSLKFGFRDVNLDPEEQIMWEKVGNQGPTWHCKVHSLNRSPGDVVFFRAVRGEDVYSIIALDNITLSYDVDNCTDCSEFSENLNTFTTGDPHIDTTTKPRSTQQGPQVTVPPTEAPLTNIILYIICAVVGVAVIGVIILVIAVCKHRRKQQQNNDRDLRMQQTRQNQQRPSVTPSEKYSSMPKRESIYEGLKPKDNEYDYIDDVQRPGQTGITLPSVNVNPATNQDYLDFRSSIPQRDHRVSNNMTSNDNAAEPDYINPI